MINCEECGKRMSDTATSCPNCGARHKAVVRISAGRKNSLIIFGFIITMIGVVLYYNQYTTSIPDNLYSIESMKEWSSADSSLRMYYAILTCIGIGLLIGGLFSKTKE